MILARIDETASFFTPNVVISNDTVCSRHSTIRTIQILPDRLMVGRRSLKAKILVRFQVRQQQGLQIKSHLRKGGCSALCIYQENLIGKP